MGGKGSGRKIQYNDEYHKVQREKMREVYKRKKETKQLEKSQEEWAKESE